MLRRLTSRFLHTLLLSSALASALSASSSGTSNFRYIAPNLVALPGETVTVPILLDNNFAEVQGWSIDLEIAAPLQMTALTDGSTTAGLNSGSGPDFNAPTIHPGQGFTTGVVISFMGHETLSLGTGYELQLIDVMIPSNAVAGTVYPLTFVETIGSPPVANIVVVGGFSNIPEFVNGSIEVGFSSNYCFGDGTASPCPCGNFGGEGEGCRNSAGIGAVLATAGSSSSAADDLLMSMTGGPGVTAALLFAGTIQVNGGNGLVFGDGLRCAGGQVRRLGVRICDPSGSASWGPNLGAQGGWGSGDTRYYQSWYRDVTGSPCGGQFNLSQGVAVTFTP